MPSTYSNLKIQLMATGENATTWGVVTNLNLGTAIEEAIVGSADVTFASGNVTLTLTDTNTTQTARNVRLRCTGTTGGSTRNLVVPSIEKPYIVKNDCADSILVKTAAGTGITVPAGKTMWVYSDGVNVVDVVTHLSGLTLSTALAVAQGGTGATTASDARTNLGATAVGSSVFTAASATAGRAALSAAASGANSDITSLSGLTTALSIAQGGTGATTASAARTALGATTLGANIFTVANPGAITFPRFNADNTISALSAADFRTAIGTGTGTVTSVAGTGSVNGLTLSGTVTSSGNITLGGSVTSVATTATIDGYAIGYRSIPRSLTTTTAAYSDIGKCIAITAGITIPANTFIAGDAVSIYNNSAGALTITQGSGLTLRQAGTANTGNRTLAQRGMCTVWFNSTTEAVISGAGLS